MIFFDLDDTLMDFKQAEQLAVKAFYDQFSDSIDQSCDEFYENWCRIGLFHYERFLRGELTFEQQQAERMIDLLAAIDTGINRDNAMNYFQIYLKNFEDNWLLFDDVIPCLESLKNHRLGIITNGDSVQQRQKLQRLGISDSFEIVVVSGDIGVSKPNPEIFKHACKLAHVNPADCFFIGDNIEADVLSCEKINMKGIWLNRKNDERRHRRTIRSLIELKTCMENEFGGAAGIV